MNGFWEKVGVIAVSSGDDQDLKYVGICFAALGAMPKITEGLWRDVLLLARAQV